jgi:hypothetical protein
MWNDLLGMRCIKGLYYTSVRYDDAHNDVELVDPDDVTATSSQRAEWWILSTNITQIGKSCLLVRGREEKGLL